MPFQDAELAKVAFNAFLCTKISFGNFLAQLCDRLGGADIDAMAETFGLDPRIGRGLLRGGAPFGGTCLPRDIQALVYLSETLGIEAPLPQAVAQVNAVQYNLIERYVAELEPRCVGILGLSFKSDTSVTIGSPGFEFIRRLLKRSISVVAFDPMPQARDDARHEFGSDIVCSDTVQDCIDRSDTLLLCNADPAYAELPRKLNHSHRIVDPWGCVQLPHPVLIQTGRRPIGSNQPSGEEILKITE
jgi:UDPglucose 6-dehydrogenase